jgi:hypothetical protein
MLVDAVLGKLGVPMMPSGCGGTHTQHLIGHPLQGARSDEVVDNLADNRVFRSYILSLGRRADPRYIHKGLVWSEISVGTFEETSNFRVVAAVRMPDATRVVKHF